MTPFYVAGLDLGQAKDYSALGILEVTPTGYPEMVPVLRGRLSLPDEQAVIVPGPPVTLTLRWLERYELGTTYPTVVQHVRGRLAQLPADHLFAVDATGVGRAVVDMFRLVDVPLLAVTITSGNTANGEAADWAVPKRDLVHGLLVGMQEERFTASNRLPLSSVLMNELTNFQMKVNLTTGHDSYEAWRESVHDDLVLAVSIAAWYAEREVEARARQVRQGIAAQITAVNYEHDRARISRI